MRRNHRTASSKYGGRTVQSVQKPKRLSGTSEKLAPIVFSGTTMTALLPGTLLYRAYPELVGPGRASGPGIGDGYGGNALGRGHSNSSAWVPARAKIDGPARPVGVVDAIDQKEVTADVAFPVARP